MDHSSAVANTARYAAIAQGLLATLIAGSTFVIVKMALVHLGPLTIIGLRFWLTFTLLLPFVLRHADVRHWEARIWIRFVAIGLSFCVLGNGAVHLGLKHIPATMGSFLMNMVPLLVLLGGLLWLRETPTPQQVTGIVVSLAGSTLFFAPGLKADEARGIAIFGVGLVGIASYGILGREIARDRWVDTLSLTAVPMVFGGGILLAIAFAVEGLPQISASVWALLFWLAIVNTACVLILYNLALRSLKAFEMSVILSLSPVVTAFWAWALLDERLAIIQLLGMVTMILGVVLVQWRRKNS